MRTKYAALLTISLALACNKAAQPPASGPAPVQAQLQPQPTQANVLRGKVLEKIDAAQYSYLKLQTASGEVWTAVPQTAKAVGAEAGIVGPIWMENFKSAKLNRTWERIAFGTLEDEAPPGAQQLQQPATSASGAGMFAAAAAQSPLPAGHPAPAAAADVGDVKVKSAGKTIAQIYAGKAALKDKPITVRGKVVKATNGVMGKNWLHLRDGSGTGPTADLTVASEDTAAIGDVVLVNGTVHLDRDLGAGYHYDVLIEDAHVKKE